jgi:hypothetical protein
VAALLCLLAIRPGVALAANGAISGTVETAAGAVPIAGVEVCAYPYEEEGEGEIFGCDLTGVSGAYTIEELPPGEYEVEFWGRPQGYATQFYDHRSFSWESDPVPVASGATTTEVDADLIVEARIEGVVRSASTGADLEEVEVCAWDLVAEGGRCTYTEEKGQYAIGGLVGADYVVEFFPFDPFQVQFWDHKSDLASANELSLAPGDVATGVNADLLGGPAPPAPPVITPPVVAPVPAAPKPKHCKKGFRKKRVKGKARCVKIKKRRHKHPGGSKRSARLALR